MHYSYPVPMQYTLKKLHLYKLCKRICNYFVYKLKMSFFPEIQTTVHDNNIA